MESIVPGVCPEMLSSREQGNSAQRSHRICLQLEDE